MIQTGCCLPEWSNMFYGVCLFLSTCDCRKREASAIELVFCTGFEYLISQLERVPKGLHRFLFYFEIIFIVIVLGLWEHSEITLDFIGYS